MSNMNINVMNNGQLHQPSHAAVRLYLGIINDREYHPWLSTQDGVDKVLRDVLRVINRYGYVFNERVSLDDLCDADVRWIEANLFERIDED